jgi:hypothetical protein
MGGRGADVAVKIGNGPCTGSQEGRPQQHAFEYCAQPFVTVRQRPGQRGRGACGRR